MLDFNSTSILNRLKEVLNISSNAELSRHLDVRPQTISSWYSRNTLDIALIATKCVDVDYNYIFTGSRQIVADNTESRLLSIIESQQRTIENLTKRA